MKIFYRDSMVAYYPTEVISKIQFDKDSSNNMLLNVYVFGYPTSYKLSDVDSIYFYIDIYQPLTIGSQVWMLKNLNVDHYRNEDSIPEVRDAIQWSILITGGWCYYNNDVESYGSIYGKLYNWFAVNDSRGIAPTGWHVPSDDEWTTLTTYLGGESVAGGKIKEIGIAHWWSPNTGATNESGFSALPGGWRSSSGTFGNIRTYVHWWSSTEGFATYALYRFLYNSSASINRSDYDKENGFSIRCIKDNEK